MTRSQTPRSQQPFIPLNEEAPRVTAKNPAPAPAVNWFERIAPEFSPDAPGHRAVYGGGMARANPNTAVRHAGLPAIEEILAREHEKQIFGLAEPVEVLQMRAEAEAAARQMVGQAYTQAQGIEDEARQRGYEAGFATGFAAGEMSANQTVMQQAAQEKAQWQEEIAAFVAHIEATRQQIWNDLEPQIISLTFDLAQHVIKAEIEASRDVVLPVLQNALRRVADAGTLRVRVHPDDLETVRSNREELLHLVDGIRHIEIVEDRRVDAGGCIVETGAGNIDARIETQTAEMRNMLEQAVAHRLADLE